MRSVTKGSARGDGKEAHLSLIRSLSNNDGDVNENGKKLLATCNNLISCKTTPDSRVVKRATQLFNYCSNFAKQVARFCCPFYRTLWVL